MIVESKPNPPDGLILDCRTVFGLDFWSAGAKIKTKIRSVSDCCLFGYSCVYEQVYERVSVPRWRHVAKNVSALVRENQDQRAFQFILARRTYYQRV